MALFTQAKNSSNMTLVIRKSHANNKHTDQPTLMCSLISNFVVKGLAR